MLFSNSPTPWLMAFQQAYMEGKWMTLFAHPSFPGVKMEIFRPGYVDILNPKPSPVKLIREMYADSMWEMVRHETQQEWLQ